jgi:hypothetical protein
VRNLQVVADKDNNTLLIIATAAEYSVIESRCASSTCRSARW